MTLRSNDVTYVTRYKYSTRKKAEKYLGYIRKLYPRITGWKEEVCEITQSSNGKWKVYVNFKK